MCTIFGQCIDSLLVTWLTLQLRQMDVYHVLVDHHANTRIQWKCTVHPICVFVLRCSQMRIINISRLIFTIKLTKFLLLGTTNIGKTTYHKSGALKCWFWSIWNYHHWSIWKLNRCFSNEEKHTYISGLGNETRLHFCCVLEHKINVNISNFVLREKWLCVEDTQLKWFTTDIIKS